MHVSRNIFGLAVGLLATLVVHAQVPSGAPAGSTGQCKDGSYYSGASKQGACRGHKGVKDWYGAGAAAAPAAAEATTKRGRRTSAKETPAAAPAAVTASAAPGGATGQCNDGSYYTGASKKGACRGHKGVKDWYGAASAPAASAATAAAAPVAAAPATAAPATTARPATPAAPAAPVAAPAAQRYTPPAVAAAGGGAGQVWVNSKTKVYHCESDSLYGKTKDGVYMTEAAAQSAGNRPARGKTCH